MSHWAELDENNIVIRVVVGDNNEPDKGYKWLVDNLGGVWIETSYNANIRFNYAGIGFTYDKDRDAFIAPKTNCHIEEILNENICSWTCSNKEHLTEIPTPPAE